MSCIDAMLPGSPQHTRRALGKWGGLLLLAVLTVGCGSNPAIVGSPADAKPHPAVLTQVSTLDALMGGVYDGETTLAQLKQYGNLGLGTFNTLDGEMVVVDGHVYQARADGKVNEPPDSTQTPFAAVTFFQAGKTRPAATGLDFARLQQTLDSQLPSKNLFYAFRLEGRFQSIKVRSVPRQSRPYPILPDVVKKQAVFDLENVEGVLVGFRSPAFAKGLNAPGYHLHFLSKDKQAGGHVLDFVTDKVEVATQPIHDFRMLLPQDQDFYTATLPFDPSGDMARQVETKPLASPAGKN
ncbi:acetolactate decarboxylase [Thiothrix nivea]|nr:acetolactate decarboxylase [Thiothrix nivea]